MQKLKVLQFTISNSKGGRSQYVLNNLRFIDRKKFRFDFVTFSPKIDYEDELTSLGCKIHYVTCYPEENEIQFIKEFKVILSYNYDVIHIHTGFWKSFIVEKLSREAGIPLIIVHSHNSGCFHAENCTDENIDFIEHMRLRDLIAPEMADRYMACSRVASEWLFGDKILKDEIVLLKNAIDTDKFSFNDVVRNQYRKELNIDEKFVLGNVGRMEYQKNHEFLIEVFEAISKVIDDAVLLLVGDGKKRYEIEEIVEKKNLQKRVIMLGKRDDTNRLMQTMDLFLLPSRFEGFPIVLVEAQTAGLPCIVSDQVTEEAKITSLVEYCSLKCDEWLERIKRKYFMIKGTAAEYKRRDMSKEITEAGFNIREQIKALESIYSQKVSAE